MRRDHGDATDEQDDALQAAIQRSLTDRGPVPASEERFERPPPYNPHYNPDIPDEVEDQEQHIGFEQVHDQIGSDPPASGSQASQDPTGFEAAQGEDSTSSEAATGFDAVHNGLRDEMGRYSLRQRRPQGGGERSLDDLRAARLARLNNVRQH